MKTLFKTTFIAILINTVGNAQQIGDGLAQKITNMNVQLLSGAYGAENATGRPPGIHPWTHLLHVRHTYPQNNHALQIASDYAPDDRLYFRKFAYGELTPQNPTWIELATRGANTFKGLQTILGGHGDTRFLMHAENGAKPDADLFLWASEPNVTWSGVGISNNIYNHTNNVPFTRINTDYGGSYMRLLDDEIRLNLVSSNGTDRNVVSIKPEYFQSNQNIGVKTLPGGELLTGATIAIGDSDTGFKQIADGDLSVYTNNVDRFRFNSLGSIGIGAVPASNLLSGPAIAFGDSDTGFKHIVDGQFSVFNNNVETVRFNVAGVGIGTTTPTSKLTVAGDFQSTVPGSSSLINAMTVDVTSFGTQANAAASSFFRVRDINAGNITQFIIKGNGNVGIGSLNPDERLTVNGTIHSKEVKVDLLVPADYVFQKYYTGASCLKEDYTMPTLKEVEDFTKANHHLPNVPSAQEIRDNGLQLGEMSNLLLQKIEELTLYAIEQDKKMEKLEAENKSYKALAERLEALEKALKN